MNNFLSRRKCLQSAGAAVATGSAALHTTALLLAHQTRINCSSGRTTGSPLDTSASETVGANWTGLWQALKTRKMLKSLPSAICGLTTSSARARHSTCQYTE